ncbi:hypothetical protein [Staphylococcus haemolyticus]|uniref:hypothetical protein n=1 Tax=Staphylococcus haemolyticus TaxID=1283 RepID=UPI000D1DE231|nr:hypothetical protein [Staphylococcus haemolyticus]PTK84588.1 hypothetical protein BUZ16_04075 [Staphylococcus haemolyticus]PTL05566.1 hypothetical protein BUZ41_00635 [Staphylococcus haemolyticus]PTL14110.1 hypothetical protein BUZ30_10515 [Staphylococcus haemolyticus]
MELLKDLELVEVSVEDGRAELTFLDEENMEIRAVKINKKKYDQDKNKWYEDPEQAEKAEKLAQDEFGVSFEDLENAVGQHKDIYAYDKFNSLFEVQMIEKFDTDQEGLIFQTEIAEITEDNVGIHIRFEYEGEKYESKMTYSTYLEAKKQFIVDPIKKQKQYEKFENKFNKPIEEKDELIGQNITVEVKVAFGKFAYCEIKNIPKRK